MFFTLGNFWFLEHIVTPNTEKAKDAGAREGCDTAHYQQLETVERHAFFCRLNHVKFGFLSLRFGSDDRGRWYEVLLFGIILRDRLRIRFLGFFRLYNWWYSAATALVSDHP